MDFAFSDEQEMIRASAEGFLADVSDCAAVRAAMVSENGYDTDLWQRLCSEMYWPAIHIPEAYGGLGLGFVELAILLEQMGRRLLCSPFFATACLATPALLLAGSEAQKQRWLPAIAEGRVRGTLAFGDGGAWTFQGIGVTATPEGDGYVLDGEYAQVIDGHSADLLVVAARLAGSTGEHGIGLFLVEAGQAGLARQWQPTMDQTRRLGRMCFTRLYVAADAVLGEAGQAWPQLQNVLRLACVGLAAEQVGGAQQALDLSVAYLQERQQFGRPLASFQALKHRAADMMLQVECARSASYYAACVAQEALDPAGDAQVAAELPLAAALAKSQCSQAYFHCAAESIQLHGGVGFTWEYDPHLYFKRARASESYLGAPAWHLQQIANVIIGEQP
ncbi:acyl-CoA dehydrogenase family protein [Pseudomonas guariconensis]|uniref:acyl-CoA dehydrogenase family protein n=1 Tax=Pseudomonas guariconensis TaxID=1288410 RepID=UPI0018A8BF76|nr:acyl-CoA dehydrogenase family protein [Pseudomonas guariconensis]MBF8739483.1 acyl-CoA dehydrogenase family protein [Pseudomonas guariconensis]MBF8750093.1 acyl-CoA dehydrogenase family protein [Pseudomonas guariconensis]